MEGSSLDKETRLSQLYLAIISRYKEYIEGKEELAVAELPMLVSPKSEFVSRKTTEIKTSFQNYSYERDFMSAAMKAYDFVHDDIEEIILPLQFWLTPDETAEFRLGDRIDRNILLCSMLVALGNPASKVFVIKREGGMSIYTYFEFGGKTTLMNVEDGINDFPSREYMISSFRIGEDDNAYEFNNQSYIDVC